MDPEPTHALVSLGIPSPKVKKLCKTLSVVSARSYAIYLAHQYPAWHHKTDLIVVDDDDADADAESDKKIQVLHLSISSLTIHNFAYLQQQGIDVLYHFTDATNLESIRKNGLLSSSSIAAQGVTSVMNSDELSRKLDRKMDLADYVRLSLNHMNPMQYIAVKQKRVTELVMLQVKLEVVSRPNVMFFDRNATKTGAVKSGSADVIRFDVVKAKNQFAVDRSLKHFYQAEVLVPSPVPPELIVFPDTNSKPRVSGSVTKCEPPPSLQMNTVSQPRLSGTLPLSVTPASSLRDLLSDDKLPTADEVMPSMNIV